jgi:hypothetical protein
MGRDLERELRFHFETQVADRIRSGIPETEVRRLTRLEFGGIDQIKEDCRRKPRDDVARITTSSGFRTGPSQRFQIPTRIVERDYFG